jgi:hypothetical protein
LIKLGLRAPIIYTPCHLELKDTSFFPEITEKDEFLFCFELDPVQSQSIEPERDWLLGPLLFSGHKPLFCPDTGDSDSLATYNRISLPEGEYLFVQGREAGSFPSSGTEEWLDLAIELQKDGLWETYKPENRLFVRFVFEDGMWVTQLFRPLSGSFLS